MTGGIVIQRINGSLRITGVIKSQYRCQLPGTTQKKRLNSALRILFTRIYNY